MIADLLLPDTEIHEDPPARIDDAVSKLSAYRRDVYDLLLDVDPAAAWRYAHCREMGAGWVGYCPTCEASSPDFYARYAPASCMLRICPDCGQAVAAPIRDHYRPIIEHIFDHMRPYWSVKGITLTTSLQLGENSGEAARRVIEWAMEWSEQMILCHEGAGVIVALEAGEQGQKFHAHVTAYSPFLQKHEMSRVWNDVTGGNGKITWVRRYESADEAIREGLKYITKFVNLTPRQLVDLHVALKGTRRIRSRGCFYLSENNPLSDFLKSGKPVPCACPQCNSKLAWISEHEFEVYVKNTRPWLVDMDTARAVEFLQVAVGSLDLIEQISRNPRGSPTRSQ